ncbi:MAG TPA: hypothetical protein VF553_08855 [Pyrinomonadaceae bacterium]|jgi:hypothetical protein
MTLSLIGLGLDDSNAWRALAVTALALAAFALNRYRHSLKEHPRRARLSLTGLRAASFLLLICALAGVRVNYEGAPPVRLLVRYVQSESLSAEGEADRSADADESLERTLAALRGNGFEPVAETAGGGALRPGDYESIAGEGFAAAVLLTDAAMSATDARREVERASAAAGGGPVYVVTDLQKRMGPGVTLGRVEVLGRPVRGVPLTLRCAVHGLGMRGHESLVTISDTARVESSARVSWNGDDEWQVITLEVLPKVAGWANYVARVEQAGVEEASLLSRPLTLYVEERRLKVLFFEGEPTWEAKFIRRALEQTGLFELDYFAQVSRVAAVGMTTTEDAARQKEDENVGGAAQSDKAKTNSAAASPEARLHRALASAASLNAYDAIIVGATPNSMLSESEVARLADWIERRGGGLTVLGGNSFAGSIAAPNGRLYTLLPTDIDPRSLVSETQQVSRGAPLEAEKTRGLSALVPTEAGAGGPLRGYLKAVDGTLAAVLTGQGFVLRGLRPGASVLAASGQSGVASGAAAGVPLIAAMRYGAGRVLLFAPSDSWRIRTSASGAQDDTSGPFGALWQGLTMWAAEGARPQVEIVLDEESPGAGQEVTAEIRVRDASFALSKPARIRASLHRLTEGTGDTTANDAPTPREIPFTPDENDTGVWRARFVAPSPGQFSLKADYTASRVTGSTEKRFAVVSQSPIETGAAEDTLRRAARTSGGQLFAADQMNALLEHLRAPSPAADKARHTWELRTWPPLALFIPLLLSGEWLARRWWRID